MEVIIALIVCLGLTAGGVYLFFKLVDKELLAPKFPCVECDKCTGQKCMAKLDGITGSPKYCIFVRGSIACHRNAKRKVVEQMNFIVKDPSINCVMSEDGKHWLLTTYEKPEPERTCTFSKYEKLYDPYPTCSACGYETDWHECEQWGTDYLVYEKNYCPNCGARVMGD